MKRILISLLVVGALIGAVYGAAASINITGVDNLGSGSSSVTANPNVIDVSWNLLGTDTTKLDSMNVEFASVLAAGTSIGIQLWDDNTGNVCDGTVKEQTNQSSIINSILGTDAILTFDLDNTTNAGAVKCVDITYAEPAS